MHDPEVVGSNPGQDELGSAQSVLSKLDLNQKHITCKSYALFIKALIQDIYCEIPFKDLKSQNNSCNACDILSSAVSLGFST